MSPTRLQAPTVLKKGERIFFADNSKNYLTRCDTFRAIALNLGLEPKFYGGVGANVADSNVDRDIRNDFYSARAIVLYFGLPNAGDDNNDHWVLRELKHAVGSGVPCLVYVSPSFPKDVLDNNEYKGETKALANEADFGTALKDDLKRLLALS